MRLIPIGTLIKGDQAPAAAIRDLAPRGFECFALSFWNNLGDTDLPALAEEVRSACEETGTAVSAISVYGNPLRGDGAGSRTLRDTAALVEAAGSFGCSLVGCFAGRPPGASVEESIEPWRAAFSPLAERAECLGIRIAFENCRLGDTWKTGKWNIAINDDAWDLMFDALPSQAIGLEWEPCHQVEAFVDPLAQLARRLPRIFHIHGKDARLDHRLLAERGLFGREKSFASCFPGNGDTDWAALFHILNSHSYGGTVDVEGWNDADWSVDRELEGQSRALAHLKACRKAPSGADVPVHSPRR